MYGDGRHHLLTNRGTKGNKRASCGDCVFRPKPLSVASFGPSDAEAAGEITEEAKTGVMGGSAKESFSPRGSHSSSVERSSPLLPESAAQSEYGCTYVRAVMSSPARHPDRQRIKCGVSGFTPSLERGQNVSHSVKNANWCHCRPTVRMWIITDGGGGGGGGGAIVFQRSFFSTSRTLPTYSDKVFSEKRPGREPSKSEVFGCEHPRYLPPLPTKQALKTRPPPFWGNRHPYSI